MWAWIKQICIFHKEKYTKRFKSIKIEFEFNIEYSFRCVSFVVLFVLSLRLRHGFSLTLCPSFALSLSRFIAILGAFFILISIFFSSLSSLVIAFVFDARKTQNQSKHGTFRTQLELFYFHARFGFGNLCRTNDVQCANSIESKLHILIMK